MERSKIQLVLIKAGTKKITRKNMGFGNFKTMKVYIMVFFIVTPYNLVS